MLFILLIFFLIGGYFMNFHIFIFFFLIIPFLHLFFYQIKIFNLKIQISCLKAFKSNNFFGLLVFFKILIVKNLYNE